MITNTIGKLFDFLPETNLVEEDFYNHEGIYPVFSGQTEGQGIVAYIDSYNQQEPSVTFTTYGAKAAKMCYRTGNYTIGRNCMGLRPKEESKKDINLEWFAHSFQNLFYRLRHGPIDGQRSLNKVILENITINIPIGDIQTKELKFYLKIEDTLRKIKNITSELESIYLEHGNARIHFL